jgi:hypothetical protein
MKFFSKAADGGKDSGVTGFFLVEIKSLFSIVLLHFRNGSREAYHSHAFNALTLWLKGSVREQRIVPSFAPEFRDYRGGQLKYTSRDTMHRVLSFGDSWALSIRGPWTKTWQEFKNGKLITLTNGRKVVEA